MERAAECQRFEFFRSLISLRGSDGARAKRKPNRLKPMLPKCECASGARLLLRHAVDRAEA
jgi:hypothetical protein